MVHRVGSYCTDMSRYITIYHDMSRYVTIHGQQNINIKQCRPVTILETASNPSSSAD